MHEVSLILGSNIEPEINLRRAIRELTENCTINQSSPVYETQSEGSIGPNYLNAVVILQTPLQPNDFKFNILRKIEARLGRIRNADKNAPRTIDLDILVFDNQVIDPNIWSRVYIAKPLSDIRPALRQSESSCTLLEIANELSQKYFIKTRPDIDLLIPY
jgi:2-amino-4-hydroxy-6-hydroxymethyldihydropteridine diphosphokinase